MRHRLLLLLFAAATSLMVGVLGAADGQADLERARRRTSALDAYSFVTSYRLQGLPLLPAPPEVRGTWNRGIAHFVSESSGKTVEVYRMNGTRVVRKQDGSWEPAPAKGPDNREGGRGPKAPHEDLAALGGEARAVSRSDGFEVIHSRRCVAYDAELTARGTRDLVPVVGMPIDTSDGGKARIWVDDDGYIQKYSMAADVKATILGWRFNVRVTSTTELRDIGKPGAKPPDEVMRLLKPEK